MSDFFYIDEVVTDGTAYADREVVVKFMEQFKKKCQITGKEIYQEEENSNE